MIGKQNLIFIWTTSFSDLRERQHYEFWVVARTAIGTNQIYHSIRENCF